MYREGANPDDIAIEDVLCDFCGRAAWAAGLPCVEGHNGSLICGDCLTRAWLSIAADEFSDPSTTPCTMCLEVREGAWWRGDHGEAHICRRCTRQSAGVLHKSKDWDWVRPTP